MSTSGSLDGRAVLITGAGSGIGRGTALQCAQAGAHVICADIAGADDVAAEIQAAGGTGIAQPLDVRDAGAWSDVVASIVQEHGALHGLCNIAGVVSKTLDTTVDQDEDGWDFVIGTDLKGVWLGMRAALPHMFEAGEGRIVNVASVAGVIGMPGQSAYSAAKGGVIGLSRQTAIEYASKNVKVNVIAPGIIQTPILEGVAQSLKDQIMAATPLGRLGETSDIGATIVHLLGPGGDFITGQVLNIDGGWTAQ